MSENGNMPDTLEFPCDPESLPTSTEVPLGTLILEGIDLKSGRTKENTTGERKLTGELKVGNKVMVTASFKVVEPEEYAGFIYFHRFVIGTDHDPGAELDPKKHPNTSAWSSRNARDMMGMLTKHMGLACKTMAEFVAAFRGSKVGATVKKGRASENFPAQNEVKEWWKPGTKQVKVQEANADLNAVLGRSATIPNHPAYSNND